MDIVHEIDIHTTAQEAYAALTTQAGLAAWYTAQSKAEPKVGAIVQFKFGISTTLTFRVDKLTPGRLVVWSGVDVPEEWKRTPIIFEIEDDDDGILLRFRQTGFDPGYAAYAGFNYCWAQYVRSIKLLLEAGTGEPFGSDASIACGTTPRRAL